MTITIPQPGSMEERLKKETKNADQFLGFARVIHREAVDEIITLSERTAEERVLRDIDSIIFTHPFMLDEVAASVRAVRRKISYYAKSKGITL